MKQRIYLIALLLSAVFSQGFSQYRKTVTGIVKDNKGNGLIGVSVSLLKAKDSSLVKVGVSEKDGSFEINTNAAGSFLLSYNTLGFAKQYSKVFDLTTADSYTAATVSLSVAANKLEEVTVTSTKKPMIEVKADKMVFNVESSINAT